MVGRRSNPGHPPVIQRPLCVFPTIHKAGAAPPSAPMAEPWPAMAIPCPGPSRGSPVIKKEGSGKGGLEEVLTKDPNASSATHPARRHHVTGVRLPGLWMTTSHRKPSPMFGIHLCPARASCSAQSGVADELPRATTVMSFDSIPHYLSGWCSVPFSYVSWEWRPNYIGPALTEIAPPSTDHGEPMIRRQEIESRLGWGGG